MFQTGVFKVMGRSNDLEAGVPDLRGHNLPPKTYNPTWIYLLILQYLHICWAEVLLSDNI